MSSSIYKTSDFLKDRHPYNDKTFVEKIEDQSPEALVGYGVAGIERFVVKLCDREFPMESKAKSIQLLYPLLSNTEYTLRAIDLGMVGSFKHLFSLPIDETMRLQIFKDLSRMVIVPQGIAAFEEHELLMDTLEHCLMPVQDSQGIARRLAAVEDLRLITDARAGLDHLVNKRCTGRDGQELACVSALTSLLSTKVLVGDSRTQHAVLDTLRRLCESPGGRSQAIAAGLLSISLALLIENQNLDWNNPDVITAVRDSAFLFWNLSLDAEAKEAATPMISALGRTLDKANSVRDLELQRVLSGAFSCLFIHEPSKARGLDKVDDTKTVNDVLCELLALVNRPVFGAQDPDVVADKSYTEQNTIQCLRLLSEHPTCRFEISKVLVATPALLTKVYKGTTLFQPFGSSTKDLLPPHVDPSLV